MGGHLTELGGLGDELLDLGLLLKLLAVACLQPTLRGDVAIGILVSFKVRQEICDTSNGSRLALLWWKITRRDPSQRRSGRKQRQEVGGKLVGHFEYSFRSFAPGRDPVKMKDDTRFDEPKQFCALDSNRQVRTSASDAGWRQGRRLKGEGLCDRLPSRELGRRRQQGTRAGTRLEKAQATTLHKQHFLDAIRRIGRDDRLNDDDVRPQHI